MNTLEGQASYLAALEPFIEASSTLTRNELLDIAQSITSLTSKQLYEGKYYDAGANRLDQLTANWARMLVHGQVTKEETLAHSTSGAFDTAPLHELAKQLSAAGKPQ